jgi:hypothetical protein
MQLFKLLLAGIIVLSLNFTEVYSYENDKHPDTVPVLFDSEEILELTFILHLDSLYKGGFSEQKQYPGKICGFNEGHTYTIPVIFTKRGHFRKSFNVCDFPPLRVHFIGNQNINTPFEGLKKVKMVTHCQDNDSLFDQYVVQEYLFYKIYNILTDNSFKVRLAKVKYVDINKNDSLFNYAFFIENPGELAHRINGTVLDIHYLSWKAVDQYYYLLVSLFEYMIINQDWSIGLQHNIELVGIYPSLKPVMIPFDFDMSWLINIPYNHPTIAYRIGKKAERSFLPDKVNRLQMITVINKFKLKQSEILNLINNEKLLNEANKTKILTSLKTFYQLLANEQWVKKELLRPHKQRH